MSAALTSTLSAIESYFTAGAEYEPEGECSSDAVYTPTTISFYNPKKEMEKSRATNKRKLEEDSDEIAEKTKRAKSSVVDHISVTMQSPGLQHSFKVPNKHKLSANDFHKKVQASIFSSTTGTSTTAGTLSRYQQTEWAESIDEPKTVSDWMPYVAACYARIFSHPWEKCLVLDSYMTNMSKLVDSERDIDTMSYQMAFETLEIEVNVYHRQALLNELKKIDGAEERCGDEYQQYGPVTIPTERQEGEVYRPL